MTDSRSNVFIYMTGHGGDEFLKFQDNEEISAFDIADAFGGMWAKKRCVSCCSALVRAAAQSRALTAGGDGVHRYNEIFFMVDTCQANTLYSKFYSPNILATGSSEKDQNSYSVRVFFCPSPPFSAAGRELTSLRVAGQHHADNDIGVAVTDRYTHHVLTFLESINKTSQIPMQNLVRSAPLPLLLASHHQNPH